MRPEIGMARVASFTLRQPEPTTIMAPIMAIKCSLIPICFSKIIPTSVRIITPMASAVFHAGTLEKSPVPLSAA